MFYAPFDVVLSFTDVVVPDLVVEILSPSTRSRDVRLKRDLYERVGVEEYWLVDPDRDVVDVYRGGASGFDAAVRYKKSCSITTPLLPDLEIPLDRILSDSSQCT